MIREITAGKCPADRIREEIEEIIKKQEEYKKRGEEIPDDCMVPSIIEVSPDNIQYFLDSELITEYYPGSDPGEIIGYFGADKTEEFPQLDVFLKYDKESGMWRLKRIKEAAAIDKNGKVVRKAFEWSEDDQANKKGKLSVYRMDEIMELYPYTRDGKPIKK